MKLSRTWRACEFSTWFYWANNINNSLYFDLWNEFYRNVISHRITDLCEIFYGCKWFIFSIYNPLLFLSITAVLPCSFQYFYCQIEIIHLHVNLNKINFIEHFILCDLFFLKSNENWLKKMQNYKIKTTTYAMEIKRVYGFQIQTITIHEYGRFFFAHFACHSLSADCRWKKTHRENLTIFTLRFFFNWKNLNANAKMHL